jgi:hypothetical protein
MVAPAQPDALINAIEGFSAPLNGFCPGYPAKNEQPPKAGSANTAGAARFLASGGVCNEYK